MRMSAMRARLPADARVFQILFLALLLGIGVTVRDFSIAPAQILLTFAAGIGTQRLWVRALGLERVGVLSAVVTCFGLSMLLRADSLWAHPLVAAAAISSKFVIRVGGKHVYNPANVGLVGALLLLPGTWVSPGQWGNDLAYAAWFLALGGVVTTRARRIDLSVAFLACWLALVALRIAFLGQSWSILLHQMQSGALLLFAFFMISDPMTAPNHPKARLAFVALVAIVAYAWQFVLFRPNALVWALFLVLPLVPVLDRLLPADRFAWRNAPATRRPTVASPG
jgi:Na+-transporting NADH:ubiquinone oxidoreductase subunit NqrB